MPTPTFTKSNASRLCLSPQRSTKPTQHTSWQEASNSRWQPSLCDVTTNALTVWKQLLGGKSRLKNASRKPSHPTNFRPPTSRTPSTIFFRQVKRSLLNGTSAPDNFKMLLRLISAHFDHGARSAANVKLHSFEVATKKPFADNFRAFRLLTASVTDSEQVLVQSVEVVHEVVHNGVSEQYPGLMSALYPGQLVSSSKRFGSADVIWLSFDGLSTHKTRHQRRQTFYSSTPRRSFIALVWKQTHTRPIGCAAAFKCSSG